MFIFHPKGIVVKDGDTVEVSSLDLGLGFGKLTKTSIRLNGIDAPESAIHGANAVGPREIACGKKVKDVVVKWFASHPGAVLYSLSWDGNGDKFGRILGDFGLLQGPVLTGFLLANKLVKSYKGDKKTPWLDEELAIIESYKV